MAVSMTSKAASEIIQNTPSDAESREEQDGGKHKLVGGTTAKLWPDLHKGVVINTEEKSK